MSEIESASSATQPQSDAADRITSVPADVSLMTLDAGLYCVVVQPSPAADAQSGLPGVRITPAPGLHAGEVVVRTIAEDGWMTGFGDAALVRVIGGPGRVMVSIYHRPGAGPAGAPNLKVLPLMATQPTALPAAPPVPAANLPAPAPTPVDMVAHIQTRGDVGAHFGQWLGEPGSGLWIEGFAVAPIAGVALTDIEYQAVLGRGWLSPWVEGGQYCGSRGMALPILGLRVRLRGEAAAAYQVKVSASFVDGAKSGPVSGGESCEAPSLAAIEAILIELVSLKPEGPAVAAPDATASAKGRNGKGRGKAG